MSYGAVLRGFCFSVRNKEITFKDACATLNSAVNNPSRHLNSEEKKLLQAFIYMNIITGKQNIPTSDIKVLLEKVGTNGNFLSINLADQLLTSALSNKN
jgi:hypothetical protein